MAWADIAKGLGNVATWAQGGGLTENSPKRVAMEGAQQSQTIQQKEADLQEQQQQQEIQKAEMELHQHLMELGARPVVNGIVKRDLTLPTGEVVPNGLLDKADPSRTQTFKDSTGQPASYELPTTEEQTARAIKLRYPAEERATQLTGEQAKARTEGAAAGTAEAAATNRAQNGITLSADDVQRMGLPASMVGQNMLPAEAAGASRGFQNANVRADASRDVAGTKATSADNVANIRARTQAALADSKNELADKRLAHQDAWQATRARLQSQAENGRNQRAGALLVGLPTAQAQHGRAINDAYAEDQKQIQAAALLGEEEGPGTLGFGTVKKPSIENGEVFTNPFTNKTAIMTDQQRNGLQQAVEQSKKHAAELRTGAAVIEQKYGLNAPAPAQAQPAAAAPPAPAPNAGPQGARSAPAAAPPAQGATPAAAAAPGAAGAPAGKVHVQYPDGKGGTIKGWIPKANLDKAKQAQKGLTEIP